LLNQVYSKWGNKFLLINQNDLDFKLFVLYLSCLT